MSRPLRICFPHGGTAAMYHRSSAPTPFLCCQLQLSLYSLSFSGLRSAVPGLEGSLKEHTGVRALREPGQEEEVRGWRLRGSVAGE